MSGFSSQGSSSPTQLGLFLGSGSSACYGRQRQEKCCLGTVNGWETEVWERFVTTNDACCVVNDTSADFPKPGRVWKGMSCTGWRNHSSCRAKQTARSTRRDGYAGSGGLSSPRGSAATLAVITGCFGPASGAIGLLVPGVRPECISPGEAKGTHAVNPYGVANSHQRDDIRGLD
jgi:hypothetical protein